MIYNNPYLLKEIYYSDISVLGSEWDIASVNLSSGYYEEHTKKEYIIFHELIDNINRVQKMLLEVAKLPYFSYQEIDIPPFHPNETLNWWINQILKSQEIQSQKLNLKKKDE